ncbi:MAG: hypothetical protein V3R29_03420 [Candidatus Acidoferrales bacterium]
MKPNIAAALGYFFWPLAIVWLVIEPYNKDRFIRFHSFQMLGLAVAGVVLSIVMTVLSVVLAMVPYVSLILFILWPLFGLAMLGVWVFLMYKSYNNEKYKLPVIGDFAEKQAGGA